MTAPRPLLKNGLKPVHELFGDWILANPGGTLREMGAHFGYSPAWISMVLNSDMFKAYMAERLKDVHAAVTQDIPTMLRGTAALAIERMNEVLENTDDPDLIVEAFDKVLHRYGYAPNSRASPAAATQFIQQNNVFYLDREQLAEARRALEAAHKPEALDGAPVPSTD